MTSADSSDIPEQFRIRQAKRERLLAEGRDPYPVEVARTHTLAELREAYPELAADTATGLTGGVAGPSCAMMMAQQSEKLNLGVETAPMALIWGHNSATQEMRPTHLVHCRPGEPRWMLGAAVSLAAQGQLVPAAQWLEQARALGPVSPDVLSYLRQLGVTPQRDNPGN